MGSDVQDTLITVLSEKMMAWDVPSCERILDAARKSRRADRVSPSPCP